MHMDVPNRRSPPQPDGFGVLCRDDRQRGTECRAPRGPAFRDVDHPAPWPGIVASRCAVRQSRRRRTPTTPAHADPAAPRQTTAASGHDRPARKASRRAATSLVSPGRRTRGHAPREVHGRAFDGWSGGAGRSPAAAGCGSEWSGGAARSPAAAGCGSEWSGGGRAIPAAAGCGAAAAPGTTGRQVRTTPDAEPGGAGHHAVITGPEPTTAFRPAPRSDPTIIGHGAPRRSPGPAPSVPPVDRAGRRATTP